MPLRKMRQSLLNTATICQQRIPYDLDPEIPYSSGIVRAIGTAIHAAHEDYYRGRMSPMSEPAACDDVGALVKVAHRSLWDEIERADENFNWTFRPQSSRQDEVVLNMGQALDMISSAVRYYHAAGLYWPDEYRVLAIEHTFNLDWPAHPDWVLHGSPDLILEHVPTGDVLITDHKCVLKKPQVDKYAAHKTPQAAFYLHALAELGEVRSTLYTDLTGRNVRFVYDVLLMECATVMQDWVAEKAAKEAAGKKVPAEPVVFWRIEEPRSADQIAATMDQASRLADLIDAGGPYMPNPESFLCSAAYCDHWNRCPFGATLRATE